MNARIEAMFKNCGEVVRSEIPYCQDFLTLTICSMYYHDTAEIKVREARKL